MSFFNNVSHTNGQPQIATSDLVFFLERVEYNLYLRSDRFELVLKQYIPRPSFFMFANRKGYALLSARC